MTEPRPSRFDAVRGQLRLTRRLATAGAIVVFAAVAGLARSSHPGTAGTSSDPGSGSDGAAQSQTSDDSSSSFGFGDANVGPSTGFAPSIQSGGS
jgi:hypothetical protein